MERLTAKLLALIGIFVVPLVCTLLPIKVHDVFVKKGKKGEELLSWMMCFGGGVFFATYILHMGPEVRLILNDALIKPYGITYPIAELIMSLGFFLVLIIEKLALNMQKKKKNSTHKKKLFACSKLSKANGICLKQVPLPGPETEDLVETNVSPDMCKEGHLPNGACVGVPLLTLPDVKIQDNNDSASNMMSEDPENMTELEHSSRSLILAIALSLHRIFEGMSIGLKHTVRGVGSLFLAVLCHETVIGFSLGLQFVRNKFSTQRTVAFTIICSMILPVGVAIGTVVIEVGSEGQALDMVNGILQALSTGTFIYVTFFEILQGEITHNDTSMGKSFFLILGFAVMAALSAIPEPPENLHPFLVNTTMVTSMP